MSGKEAPANQNRIKQLRLEQHKTQKEVGKAIGLSDRAIAHYEKGIREPKLETWIKLANFFDVPVSYLQGISDDRNYKSLYNEFAELHNLMDKLDENSSDSNLKEVEDKISEIDKKQGLDDFSLLYIAMEKSNAGFLNTENIINSLPRKQLQDVFDIVSGVYSLALNAANGEKISQKYYKKIKQLYSDYLVEDMNNEIEKMDSSSKDDNLPF